MLRKLEFSQGVALLGQKACPSRERNPWPLPLPPFDELWTEVRRTFQDGKCWQDGPGNCVPVLAAALQRVLADLASPSLPQKWNPLEAAVLFHVLGTVGHQYPKNGDLMVEAVIAGGGLPLAIEALLQSLSLEAGGSPSCRWITRIRQEMAWYQRSNYRCWLPVRRQLTRASPADYEEAKSYALARRAHGTLQSRCLLAYAFADEPWWSDELDEVLATPPMHHGFKIYQDGGFALLANCTDLARARELCLGGNHRPEPQQAWNMALLLGDEVAPLLLELAKHQVEFLDPLVHLPSLSTAMAMKVCLDDRKQRAYAAAYYQTHPSLGMHALAQVVQAGGKLADVARSLLGGLLGGHPELVADLPERERATCEAVLAKRSRRLPEAPADAIPAMLTAPPWKAKRSKTRVTIIDGLSPPAYEDRIHWKSGRPQGYRFEPPPPQGADRRQLIALEAIIADPKGQVCLWNLETVAQDNALRLFRESDVEVWRKAWDLENSSTVLARFGLDGVPRLLELADLEPAKLFSTLELIESPGVAPAHGPRAGDAEKRQGRSRLADPLPKNRRSWPDTPSRGQAWQASSGGRGSIATAGQPWAPRVGPRGRRRLRGRIGPGRGVGVRPLAALSRQAAQTARLLQTRQVAPAFASRWALRLE
jgi:hypothetical protein